MMIVLLTNEFPPAAGGVATYCYSLAQAINGLEENEVAAVAPRITASAPSDDKEPFPIYRATEHQVSVLRHLARFRVLRRAVEQHSPSLLWAADWRTGLVVFALAMLFDLPYVVSAYGSEILLAGSSRQAKVLALQVYNKAKAVLAISNYTKKLLLDLGVAQGRIAVIPLGVDPGNWQKEPERVDAVIERHRLDQKQVILTLARLTPRKGQDTVIRALPAVLRQVPNSVYVIAGQGPDEARLRKLVADLELENRVVFAGFVSEEDKAAYYHACDVYVMLSRQEGSLVEGFGQTLLEAGACGKPVVAGRHGGVGDAVSDGETGLLVPPEDVDAVAQALTSLLTDPKQSVCLGTNARRRVETQANWCTVARQTLEVFVGTSP